MGRIAVLCLRLAPVFATLLTLLAAADARAATPAPSQAETVAAFELLKLVPPPHYCALDPGLPEEAELLELARIGKNAMAADLFVIWRDGQARPPTGSLDDYSKPAIEIAARVEQGHILHVEMSRAAFLARMDREVAASSKPMTNAAAGAAYLGVTARDDDAVYLGGLITDHANGKETVRAFVVAAPLIKGMFLQISVAQDFDGDRTLAALTSKTQEIVHRLVADNAAP